MIFFRSHSTGIGFPSKLNLYQLLNLYKDTSLRVPKRRKTRGLESMVLSFLVGITTTYGTCSQWFWHSLIITVGRRWLLPFLVDILLDFSYSARLHGLDLGYLTQGQQFYQFLGAGCNHIDCDLSIIRVKRDVGVAWFLIIIGYYIYHNLPRMGYTIQIHLPKIKKEDDDDDDTLNGYCFTFLFSRLFQDNNYKILLCDLVGFWVYSLLSLEFDRCGW